MSQPPPPSPGALARSRHLVWLPLLAMLVVLLLTWALVPQESAPFVYLVF